MPTSENDHDRRACRGFYVSLPSYLSSFNHYDRDVYDASVRALGFLFDVDPVEGDGEHSSGDGISSVTFGSQSSFLSSTFNKN